MRFFVKLQYNVFIYLDSNVNYFSAVSNLQLFYSLPLVNQTLLHIQFICLHHHHQIKQKYNMFAYYIWLINMMLRWVKYAAKSSRNIALSLDHGVRSSSVVEQSLTAPESSDRISMIDLLRYFALLFQLIFHDLCNKGRRVCYPVCGMMHIKEPLLLIGKSSPCGGSGFPLSLSEWSFTICPTPYNRK